MKEFDTKRFADRPKAEDLRSELNEREIQDGRTSVVQFGCIGCPNSQRLISQWHTVDELRTMTGVKAAESVPRAFIVGCWEMIGKAETCPINSDTQEPDCQHKIQISKTIASHALRSSKG